MTVSIPTMLFQQKWQQLKQCSSVSHFVNQTVPSVKIWCVDALLISCHVSQRYAQASPRDHAHHTETSDFICTFWLKSEIHI